MPPYDARWFSPPAPLAIVTLRNPATGAMERGVPLLIDSGSAVTLVPTAAAHRLGAAPQPNRFFELEAFDGSSSLAPIVELEFGFCRRTFRGEFLVIDQEWGVLGRNVLNNVPLLLDGPRLVWDEHRAR